MSEFPKIETISVDLSRPEEGDLLLHEVGPVDSYARPTERVLALCDGEGGRTPWQGTGPGMVFGKRGKGRTPLPNTNQVAPREDKTKVAALRTALGNLCFAAFLGGCTILILAPYIARAEVKAAIRYSAHLYAQGMEPPQVPIPPFTCDDEIHLTIKWEGLPLGKHELKILWLDSRGKVWASSGDSFVAEKEGQVFISDYWFVFKESAFERFSGWELGASRKAGKWLVQVILNGALVLAKEYRVGC